MPEEKALKPAELRKAFGDMKQRQDDLETAVKRIMLLEQELKFRLDHVKSVQAKIDRYSVEMDDALPRIIAAEAALGRANANHDKLWGLLGQTAHGITKIREHLQISEEPS